MGKEEGWVYRGWASEGQDGRLWKEGRRWRGYWEEMQGQGQGRRSTEKRGLLLYWRLCLFLHFRLWQGQGQGQTQAQPQLQGRMRRW